MKRWVAFDENTADILRRGLGEDARITLTTGSPVGKAIAQAPSVLVLPGESAVKAVLAYVEQRAPKVDRAEVKYEATGFLGLTDEPVYEDEPEPPQKKSWWKKLTN